MARPGLILDRDGTLVEERGYIAELRDLVPLPGSSETLARLKRAGVAIAVVTNQSAVGRGVVTEQQLARLHAAIEELGVDAVYHCPHLPDDGCECRKPLPALVQRALHDLDLDPARTMLVGDHLTDCLAARAAGIDAVLVRTGHGAEHEPEARAAGFVVVDDLPRAAEHYLDRRLSGRNERR